MVPWSVKVLLYSAFNELQSIFFRALQNSSVWTWEKFEKNFEVPVHMSKGKMKKKNSGVTPGGQATPLKTGIWVIIRGLSDPLG